MPIQMAALSMSSCTADGLHQPLPTLAYITFAGYRFGLSCSVTFASAASCRGESKRSGFLISDQVRAVGKGEEEGWKRVRNNSLGVKPNRVSRGSRGNGRVWQSENQK